MRWLRRVTAGSNSMMFMVITATFVLLAYSSTLYFTSTKGVLQEKSAEFALNGLLAGLGASYGAADTAFEAGLSSEEVLALLGAKESDDRRSGSLIPFIIDNDQLQIVDDGPLPDDLADEIERLYSDGEYATRKLSGGSPAYVCKVQNDNATWLAAIAPLAGTGRGFGLASDVTGFIAQAQNIERDLVGSLVFAYVYFLVLLVVVLRIITNPLRSLTRMAKKYSRGEFSHRVKVPSAVSELRVLADAFNGMGAELKRQHDSLEAYSQKLEEANKKAINAVDKLSMRNREQKAMIETSLEANKLALPEDVIRLLTSRLREDLRLQSIRFYQQNDDGLFSCSMIDSKPVMDSISIDEPSMQALKKCRETDVPEVRRYETRETDSSDRLNNDSDGSVMAENLYVPFSTGIDRHAVLELVARPGIRFEPETVEFCRHYVSHIEVILKNKALYQETVRRSHELERVNQISRSISGELDVDPLLRDVVEHTQNTIRAECAFVGIVDGSSLQIRHITPGVAKVDEWVVDLKGNPIFTEIIETGSSLVVNDVKKDHRVLPDGFIWRNKFRSFVGSPIVRKDEVLGIICGFSREPNRFRSNDAYFLSLLASQVAIALDNARLFEEINTRDKRRDHQLTMAQKLQMDRIPQFYKQNVAAVSCKLQPADELAGDFCDVFSLGRNSVAFVVGDVANKGVAASLMTFSLLSMFRNVAKTHKPPCEILESINRSLISQIKEDTWFATAFYGRLNTKNGILTYASAGHERPVWYHAETGKVEMLEAVGYPLGLFKSFPYETRELQLRRGDRIVLYTDGVTDAPNPDGNRFGHQALLDIVAESGYLSSEELTEHIVSSVEGFISGRKQKDDIIVAVLELQDDPWIHRKIVFNDSNDLITDILDALQPFELDKQDLYSIRLAIDEALANAWRHGLRHRDDVPFEVSYYINDEGFQLRVKDGGDGFDHESLPDPTVEENLYKTSGRGVFLIRKMMDEVEFNDIGNEITVFKRFSNLDIDDDSAYDGLLIDPMANLKKQQDSLNFALEAGLCERSDSADEDEESTDERVAGGNETS